MRTGIYFLLSRNRVVYIGATTCYPNRLKQHKDKKFNSYRFIPCAESQLADYEKRLINLFMPKYNKNNGASKTRKAHVEPSEKVVLVGFYTKQKNIDYFGSIAKCREWCKETLEIAIDYDKKEPVPTLGKD